MVSKSINKAEYWQDINNPVDKKPTMVGSTRPLKMCRCCGKYRTPTGSKNVDVGERQRAFVCAECVTEGKHNDLYRGSIQQKRPTPGICK